MLLFLFSYFFLFSFYYAGDTLIYEVRVAFFENGVLKQWKARLNNPIATNQFVNLFAIEKSKQIDNGDKFSSLVSTKGTYEDDSSANMYESNFSDMVLEFLPELPEGVDVFDTSTYFLLLSLLLLLWVFCGYISF